MHKDNPRHGGARITIYTDGAAKGNPGRAGWAAVFIVGKKVFEIGGNAGHATNNIMELTAPIEAMRYVKNNFPHVRHVEIISDSKYVILGITEWIHGWIQKKWRNAARKPVVNRELWEELYKLNKEIKPKWTYIKGHNENKWNERADVIASSFADGEPVKLHAR